MSDDIAGRARFYREKAQEIGRAAQLANSPDALRDFDRMAACVEKSLLSA
jgi:hypothetical protein